MPAHARILLLIFALFAAACKGAPRAPITLRVAAAANVRDVLKRIATDYEKERGVSIEVSVGSSGQLYAQIENGAPFDLFLSADEKRPAALEKKALAVAGTRFTYAVGRLALVGRALKHPGDGAQDLSAGTYQKLAIANPETAPYGVAAVQVLKKLGVWEAAEPRIVRGENVSQTLQFVDSGAAELGLVALSSISARTAAVYWKVPAELHDPIRQDGVILKAARDQAEARDFVAFLQSERARGIFNLAGYEAARPASGP